MTTGCQPAYSGAPRHQDIACTLEVLADAAADHARGAVRGARRSLRWNPRARVHQAVPRPDSAIPDYSQERGTAKHLTCLAAEMIIGAGLDSDR
jgi:hypothetical protein